MSGGDRTGPLGMGPRTGRAAGYCGGFGMPGCANPNVGHGVEIGGGRGRGAWSRGFGGGGRGWRNTFYATGLTGRMRSGHFVASGHPPTQELEKEALMNQAQALQSELDLIKKRLGEINKGSETE
jgi:hypothetical protein